MSNTKDPNLSKKALFIEYEDLKGSSMLMYTFFIIFGVAITFSLLGIYLFPYYVAGSLPLLGFVGFNLLLASAWTLVIKLINKFVIQSELINKQPMPTGLATA